MLTGYTKKFKFADKGANLERLGRYHKLFTDKVHTTITRTPEERRARIAELFAKATGKTQ